MKKKREWVYIRKPQTYEISCDKCNGTNIEWSEFEQMIWCYDCEVDTPGNGGIFSGPIPIHVLEILGMTLDRYFIKENEIRKMIIGDKGSLEWVPFCCLWPAPGKKGEVNRDPKDN